MKKYSEYTSKNQVSLFSSNLNTTPICALWFFQEDVRGVRIVRRVIHLITLHTLLVKIPKGLSQINECLHYY